METGTAIPTRPLGRSGLTVSALGVGTWALGGPFTFDGRDAGWGQVDDDVSIRALHTAIDAGVTLIDSAPTYGTGHSERVIGRVLASLPSATRDAIVATEHNLGVLARSPLAMGLLSGNYSRDRRPAPGDVRRDTPWWTYFDDAIDEWVARLDRVRALLTADGRTLVQGALGYLWALHPAVIPLPGIRTPEQAAENAYALTLGPLPAGAADQVTALLADSPERR